MQEKARLQAGVSLQGVPRRARKVDTCLIMDFICSSLWHQLYKGGTTRGSKINITLLNLNDNLVNEQKLKSFEFFGIYVKDNRENSNAATKSSDLNIKNLHYKIFASY